MSLYTHTLISKARLSRASKKPSKLLQIRLHSLHSPQKELSLPGETVDTKLAWVEKQQMKGKLELNLITS